VGRLYLFQRTAPWVIERRERDIGERTHRFFRRVPAAQKLVRGAIYLQREATLGLFRHPAAMRMAQRMALRHLRKSVPDRELRQKVTPDFTMGCKRVLLSNDYYPAITRPNVEVVTDRIAEVRPHSIVTLDGAEREVDAIIFGTGFRPTDPPLAPHVRGRGGISLTEAWAGSPKALAGTTVAGFPNLYLLLGPSLGTGHSSAFTILEAQLRHTVAAVTRTLRAERTSLSVRPEAQEAFNAEVQAALPGTVYQSGGCSSYYTDVNGRNSFSWPFSTGRLRSRVGSFDEADYEITTS
jgi:cation diffusion facilitator CzcD-associated flavoprotein CzcO